MIILFKKKIKIIFKSIFLNHKINRNKKVFKLKKNILKNDNKSNENTNKEINRIKENYKIELVVYKI